MECKVLDHQIDDPHKSNEHNLCNENVLVHHTFHTFFGDMESAWDLVVET